ncbi:MAG: glycosyltransferase family 39 protein [Bacteroidota bacterium]
MKLQEATLPGTTGRTPFIHTLAGVLLVVAGYALVHALTRLFASGNLGDDDTFDNLLIQHLSAGYSEHTGPLYDLLLWLLQQVLGSGIQAFLALKYSLLIVMAGGIFLITRRLTGSPLWGFIAVESMATVYQIFWRFHEGFTHRVGAMALAIATVWALFGLLDEDRWRHRLLLAGLAGLGLLTEHTYAFFLLALLAAAALQPAMRRRLFAWPMLAVLPLTALIVSPYVGWLLAEPQRLPALISDFYPFRPANSPAGLWSSLRDALTFPLLVLAPYILIAPLVFPKLLPTVFRRTPLRPDPAVPLDFRLLLTHLLLIEWLGVVIAGLLFSRSGYAVHSILPMFAIAIAWLTDRACATEPCAGRIRAFILVLLAFTITAYAVRCGNLFVQEPFCSRCRWGIPYQDLAGELRQKGFNSGILISNDERLSGNLRRFFPQAYLPLPGGEQAPGDLRPGEQLAVVWAVSGDDARMPPELQQQLPTAFVGIRPTVIHLPWQHLWKPRGYRHASWATLVVTLPPGKGSDRPR